MDWYKYREGRYWVIRLMCGVVAKRLGATLVPDFDPTQPVGAIVTAIAREGDLERLEPVTAEIPRR